MGLVVMPPASLSSRNDRGRVPSLLAGSTFSVSPAIQRYYEPIRLPPTDGPFRVDIAYGTDPFLTSQGWGGVHQIAGIAFTACRSENPAEDRARTTRRASDNRGLTRSTIAAFANHRMAQPSVLTAHEARMFRPMVSL